MKLSSISKEEFLALERGQTLIDRESVIWRVMKNVPIGPLSRVPGDREITLKPDDTLIPCVFGWGPNGIADENGGQPVDLVSVMAKVMAQVV